MAKGKYRRPKETPESLEQDLRNRAAIRGISVEDLKDQNLLNKLEEISSQKGGPLLVPVQKEEDTR